MHLYIRVNTKGRFYIQARDTDGYRGGVGNPFGYYQEYEAVSVAEKFRKDADDSILPGQSVHIYGSTGRRVS